MDSPAPRVEPVQERLRSAAQLAMARAVQSASLEELFAETAPKPVRGILFVRLRGILAGEKDADGGA